MISTKAIIDRLKSRVEALTWINAADETQPAFATVAFHDVTEIERALQALLMAKDRVCLIVYFGFDNENQARANQLVVTTQMKFTLVVADRNFGARSTAWLGSDTQPGVLGLADIISVQLPGHDDVAGHDVVLEVRTGRGSVLTGDARDQAVGRAVVFVDVDVLLPDETFNRGISPIGNR